MIETVEINQVKLSRILHAGYILEHQEHKIAFDPIFETPFSQNCHAFPAIEFNTEAIRALQLDAIFISHYHDDHFSIESLNLLNRKIPVYIYTVFPELISLLRDLGFNHVHSIEIFKAVHVGPIEIIPLEALDADVDSIYHIKAGGLNILNVVDSWIGPETFERLLKTAWDLVLWPYQTMREIEVIAPNAIEEITHDAQQIPPEWVEQLQQLRPKAIIPSSCQFQFESWSWYNQAFFPITYVGFAKQVEKILPKTVVHKLNPGEALSFKNTHWKKEKALDWITPLQPQDLDYKFDPTVAPQNTSDIARMFSPLSESQKNFILSYLEEGLIARYTSLGFHAPQPFTWLLKMYNHLGEPKEYLYQIQENQIQRTSTTTGAAWITEISEAKFYGALAGAESLTSIYIRVIPANQADPLEDPLIRCLYQGIIGGYQKAQLKKLGY